MSSSAASAAAPTSTDQSLTNPVGQAQASAGLSIGSFVASLGSGLAVFGVELAIFLLLNGKFSRIYAPRTFLVPERERIKPPPKGLWQWAKPVFHTSNSDFIEKCGLDAYFFLRYLRTLLKIFIPVALVILPLLLPLNAIGGRGPNFAKESLNKGKRYQNVNGLDRLAWGNVRPTETNKYWAHLVLAVGVIIYTCFVFFDELRGYIRLRQAYLTSPQHRLRASATTVLVTAIPPKWCTFEALDGLYDVFPGGIRNIWINRNFDALNDKVKRRDKLALSLESAETSLVRNAKNANLKKFKGEARRAGKNGLDTHAADKLKAANDHSIALAQTDGISSGDPHQVRHTLDEALAESSEEPSRDESEDRRKPLVPIPILGKGIDVVGHGFGVIGKTVLGELRNVEKDVDDRLNTTGGFVPATPQPVGARFDFKVNKITFGLDGERSPSVSPVSGHHGAAYDTSSTQDYCSTHRDGSDSTMRESTSQDRYSTYLRSQPDRERRGLGIDGVTEDSRFDSGSSDMDILRNPQRLGEADNPHKLGLRFWKHKQITPYGIPSPTPHGQEEDQFPLSHPSPMTPGCNPQATVNGPQTPVDIRGPPKNSKAIKEAGKTGKAEIYAKAYNEEYDPNDGNPVWKKYLREKDRDSMRLPIFGWQWMISLPLLGQKVDTINYCRKEVARLNLEIEQDQKEPEKFPLMNSAFVQFNHQVAAHMACQAISHHTPNMMAPRVVEISPDDVIWDNMSIKWWESYIRTGLVVITITGLVIGWAFPVTFTGLLSQISYLATNYTWLRWLLKAPTWVRSIIQGILPQALLGLLLLLLPVILRLLARTQGNYTGMAVELSVQQYYFAFLFVQVFLVVSISSGITTVIEQVSHSPQSVPSILAENLPKASNYFFSYLLLQALSTSAGALVQVMALLNWFILAPILDSTARQKWRRQTKLPNMQWGTFFPVYTNFACIGLIYSVISPLILVFNIITFSLFWLVYRYNTLYVTKFRFDTGGLLYPTAINQLFTGLYFMELCLIGLFFLVESVDPEDGQTHSAACKAQAIIMVIVMICTALFQWLLNLAFAPLFRYLPITLEDEAVERDEAFARAQEKRWNLEAVEQEGEEDISNRLKRHERRSEDDDRALENIELQDIDARNEGGRGDPKKLGSLVPKAAGNLVRTRETWADRSRNKNPKSPGTPRQDGNMASPRHRHQHQPHRQTPDMEAQRSGTNAIGEALFSGIRDEIEDLTHDERDQLVQRAFQHEALRARRPVIWIPRDDLGVSDDEIRRTKEFSNRIWISNESTGLDNKGRVVYRKSPPDFSEVDLIEL